MKSSIQKYFACYSSVYKKYTCLITRNPLQDQLLCTSMALKIIILHYNYEKSLNAFSPFKILLNKKYYFQAWL